MMAGTGNIRGNEAVRNEDQELDDLNHCKRSSVLSQCQEGPGRRIRNSGPVDIWDPAYEVDIGADPGWNCVNNCCYLCITGVGGQS
jgi:hypothetical protein